MKKTIIYTLLAVALFWPLARRVYRATNTPGPDFMQAVANCAYPSDCLPEQGERATYMFGALCLPALIFVISFIARRLEPRLRLRISSRVSSVAEIFLAFFLLLFCRYALRADDFFHLGDNLFLKNPLLSLPLFGLSAALVWWGGRESMAARIGSHLPVVLVAIGVFLGCVLDRKSDYASHPHLEWMFHANVQVHLGKSLLVNSLSQYGLYPHFLEPIFALWGLSILKFSVVMGAMTAVSFVALWAFLCGATTNRFVALFGFLGLVFNSSFALFLGDPYFQYQPIRFVFPVASVLLMWAYFRRPGPRLYWASTVILASGVLWNLDTGLPALLTWTATLGYADLFEGRYLSRLRKVVGHAIASTVAMAGVWLLFAASIFLRSGSFPDPSLLFKYQKVYYIIGFYTIPMKLPGAWMLVVLVYLGGLAYAASALMAGRWSARAVAVFHLSILGTGLFSYYQGRSHPNVLMAVWWPAFLLLTLLLDGLVAELRSRPAHPLPWASAALITWVLAGSSWSIPFHPRVVRGHFADRARLAMKRGRWVVGPDVAFLKRVVSPGERLVFVSNQEALYNLELGIPSVARTDYVQMLLVDDFRELGKAIDQHKDTVIFFDKEIAAVPEQYHPGLQALSPFLRPFSIVSESPRGYLLRRGAIPLDGGKLLPEEGADVPALHVTSAGDHAWSAAPLAPLALAAPFTVEAVLKPSLGGQVEAATIVGNHPGLGAYEGFTIQQSGPPDRYALITGDGTRWNVLAEFGLTPGRWSYLAVVVGGGSVDVYIDGEPVASNRSADPIIKDSALPVRVGDWAGRGRSFSGSIPEVRIVRRALDGSDLQRNFSIVGPWISPSSVTGSIARASTLPTPAGDEIGARSSHARKHTAGGEEKTASRSALLR